jgi:hypothetical protein
MSNTKPTKGKDAGSVKFTPSGSVPKGKTYPTPNVPEPCIKHKPSGNVSYKHPSGPKMEIPKAVSYNADRKSKSPTGLSSLGKASVKGQKAR